MKNSRSRADGAAIVAGSSSSILTEYGGDERDPAEMHRVEAALQEIFAAALERGGTITGEHGVGLAKKPFLRGQLGEASYTLLGTIKRALDPHNRLNPGKLVELT